MSKCQKNKYAAGGKCGSMSGAGSRGSNSEQVGEVSNSFAALLASREKQDLLFSAPSSLASPSHEHKPQVKQAIIPVKKFAKSDIDTILEGDF
jgi:hypothetical protein